MPDLGSTEARNKVGVVEAPIEINSPEIGENPEVQPPSTFEKMGINPEEAIVAHIDKRLKNGMPTREITAEIADWENTANLKNSPSFKKDASKNKANLKSLSEASEDPHFDNLKPDTQRVILIQEIMESSLDPEVLKKYTEIVGGTNNSEELIQLKDEIRTLIKAKAKDNTLATDPEENNRDAQEPEAEKSENNQEPSVSVTEQLQDQDRDIDSELLQELSKHFTENLNIPPENIDIKVIEEITQSILRQIPEGSSIEEIAGQKDQTIDEVQREILTTGFAQILHDNLMGEGISEDQARQKVQEFNILMEKGNVEEARYQFAAIIGIKAFNIFESLLNSQESLLNTFIDKIFQNLSEL